MLVVILDPILSSAIIVGSFIVLDFKLIATYMAEDSILLETLGHMGWHQLVRRQFPS